MKAPQKFKFKTLEGSFKMSPEDELFCLTLKRHFELGEDLPERVSIITKNQMI